MDSLVMLRMLLVLLVIIHVKYAMDLYLLIVYSAVKLIKEHYLQENVYVMMDTMMVEIPSVKFVKFNVPNVQDLEIINVKLVVHLSIILL